MSNEYLRLDAAPYLEFAYPTCTACAIEVDHDGEDFVCPSCGTCWPSNASESTQGELYEDWAGEIPGGIETTVRDAWKVVKR